MFPGKLWFPLQEFLLAITVTQITGHRESSKGRYSNLLGQRIWLQETVAVNPELLGARFALFLHLVYLPGCISDNVENGIYFTPEKQISPCL